jgi:uncharacterized protein (DUF362 family)
MVRSARAGASAAIACGLGLWLYDGTGPQPSDQEKTRVVLPDYSIPSMRGKTAVARGQDRIQMLHEALAALGGIEIFIRPGDRVLLKVNAAFATPPALGATTDPDLAAEMARLCIRVGAASVVVTDNPINDPASCFALTGIGQACRAAGARVVLPDAGLFRPYSVPGGTLITNWPLLYGPLEGVNKVIGLSPVKDHHRSGASMVMKNWYGLLGGRRNIFHQDIHNIIKELAMMISPTLVVLDGTVSMMTNGPTGGSLADLKQTNTLVVSTDQVAAETLGATLLGRTAGDLPYIAKVREVMSGEE